MRPLLSILSILVLSLVGFVFGQAGGKSVMGGNAVMGGGGVASLTTVSFGGYAVGSGSVANLSIAWNSSPSAGNGALTLVWHGTGTTITSVCDGTGTDGCTGSDTYTSLGSYSGTGAFISDVFLMCNLTNTGNFVVTPNTSTALYAESVWFSGQTTTGGATGCSDGGGPKNNDGASGTANTSAAITTTNAHDLLLGLFGNNTGGTYVIGTDGQGNAMTFACGNGTCGGVGAISIEYRAESATNTYTPAITGPTNTGWIGQAVAIK